MCTRSLGIRRLLRRCRADSGEKEPTVSAKPNTIVAIVDNPDATPSHCWHDYPATTDLFMYKNTHESLEKPILPKRRQVHQSDDEPLEVLDCTRQDLNQVQRSLATYPPTKILILTINLHDYKLPYLEGSPEDRIEQDLSLLDTLLKAPWLRETEVMVLYNGNGDFEKSTTNLMNGDEVTPYTWGMHSVLGQLSDRFASVAVRNEREIYICTTDDMLRSGRGLLQVLQNMLRASSDSKRTDDLEKEVD